MVKKNNPKRIQAFGVLLFWSVPKIGKTDTKKVFFGIWVQPCILRKQAQNLVKKHPKTDTSVWGFAVLERAKNRQNRQKKVFFAGWVQSCILRKSTKFGQNVTNVTHPNAFFAGWVQSCILRKSTKFGQSCKFGTHTTIFLSIKIGVMQQMQHLYKPFFGCNYISFILILKGVFGVFRAELQAQKSV